MLKKVAEEGEEGWENHWERKEALAAEAVVLCPGDFCAL